MGENCAPKIANVVLYVCKARYIDGLVNHQQVEAEHRHKIPKGLSMIFFVWHQLMEYV